MPKSGAKPTANIYINIPDDDLKELVLVGDAYIKAFIQSDLERRLDALRELRASGGIRAEDEDREGGFYVST